MNASRQSQLLWNFIVAYKQHTGRQLSYVNLSRDRAALQQALTQASQLRNQTLQTVIAELEADLLEAMPTENSSNTLASLGKVPNKPAATTPISEFDAAKHQGYVDMIAACLGAGPITLEQRYRLDQYCLEHGLSWTTAEAIERLWRAANKATALSWREEFKRGVATLQKQGSIKESDRLRLYHTFIKRERLTVAEAENLTASVVTQEPVKMPTYRHQAWGVVAVASFIIALVLGLPWLIPIQDGALNFATAQRGKTELKVPRPIPEHLSPILRIHGSNTIGAHFAPALAEAYLNQLGSASVQNVAGPKENETNIYGFAAKNSYLVEVRAHGSGTAFTSLGAGLADIGAASRSIKDKELESLKNLGDLTSAACEHVIALDGVAVIVHPSNPIMALSKDQIAAIFSGEIKDWKSIGGNSGPIRIHARDDKSGTYDTFNHIVMGQLKIDATAKRYESNDLLSDQVANDPAAIGFVALPSVHNSKALAISDGGPAILPTRFTIATEDYPLSRRLFFYISDKSSKYAQEFINLALSDAGQAIAAKVGFIDLRPEPQNGDRDSSSPHRYLALTENAQRLSLNLRFRPGNNSLDNKAQRDLVRLVAYFSQPSNATKRILLLGFSDNSGIKAQDQKHSEHDARAVADALQMRGIYPSAVEGFGAALPIADNSTPAGRAKNRRVEIWLR